MLAAVLASFALGLLFGLALFFTIIGWITNHPKFIEGSLAKYAEQQPYIYYLHCPNCHGARRVSENPYG